MNLEICKKCKKYWGVLYQNKNEIDGGFICYDDKKGESDGCYKSALISMKAIISLINKNKNHIYMRGHLFNSVVLGTKKIDAEIKKEMKKINLESFQCPYFIEHKLSEMNDNGL